MRTAALAVALVLAGCVHAEASPVPDRAASVRPVVPPVVVDHGWTVLPSVQPRSDARHPIAPIHPIIPEPIAPVRVVVVPTPRPRALESGGHHAVRGQGSWFCGAGSACTHGFPASGLYAAAGPALRVGQWRGRVVHVMAGGRSVQVTLVDWCACPSRVIDLYRTAFSRLADPSRGILTVSVSW